MQMIVKRLGRFSTRTRTLLLTSIYGLAAGLAAVGFQLGVKWMFNLTLVRLSHTSFTVFAAGSLAVVCGTSAAVGYLLNSFCREAAGSGIPQLKLAFWKDFGTMPWRVVWVKFVAGVLSIGGGTSLGREGPSVHLGGAVASNLAGLAGEAKQSRRAAAASGAAAGLAAAFNTPLAAITFVLEEIIEDLNSRLLGGVLLASVIGAFVVHGLVGKQPAFTLSQVDSPTWPVYLLIPLVAGCGSAAGLVFQKATLALRAERRFSGMTPSWFRPVLGGLVTWVLGVSVFMRTGRLGVFSLGYDDLSDALANHVGWTTALLLLAAKLLATVTSYGFGGCGGIFSPTLFMGGMCGVFLGGVCGLVVPLTGSDHIILTVVGMSSCLGSVVGAPVTGILIVFEMTHQFELVPALMLGSLVSQAVSRRFSKENFYQAVLLQDGHNLDHVMPPRDLQSWRQLPVSAITNFQPAVLRGLDAETVRLALAKHPYRCFPVAIDGNFTGLLAREEAKEALARSLAPAARGGSVCLPTQTIGELELLLIEAPHGLAVVLDKPGGAILGLVTLHDLLRAQVAMSGG
jgi:CIC family chloride channel protein